MPYFHDDAPVDGVVNIALLMDAKKRSLLIKKYVTMLISSFTASNPDCRVLDIHGRSTMFKPIGFLT
jgi:hypothetical protein